MRNRLKYGVPAAAGLATGGYALSQGEDPGSAGLAAIAGGLGGAAGLLGARNFALLVSMVDNSTKSKNALGGLEDRLSRASYGAKNDLVSDALLDLLVLLVLSPIKLHLVTLAKVISGRRSSCFCWFSWLRWCCPWWCNWRDWYAWLPATGDY
jgi:hypothetical protein